MEVFKDIIGYEGLYQISDYGRVKSFHRGGRIMKIFLGGRPGNQYYYVNLSKDGNMKGCRINVLVGIHHIPNPLNLPEVNHIDGNKLNNHKSNLEWSTSSYNTIHAFENGLGNMEFKPRKVIQLDLNGNFIKEYRTIAEAGRENNLSRGNICKVCQGKVGYKTSGGYLWKYA